MRDMVDKKYQYATVVLSAAVIVLFVLLIMTAGREATISENLHKARTGLETISEGVSRCTEDIRVWRTAHAGKPATPEETAQLDAILEQCKSDIQEYRTDI